MLSKSRAGENYENYSEHSREWPINASVLDEISPPCSPEALVVNISYHISAPTTRRQDGMARGNNNLPGRW